MHGRAATSTQPTRVLLLCHLFDSDLQVIQLLMGKAYHVTNVEVSTSA